MVLLFATGRLLAQTSTVQYINGHPAYMSNQLLISFNPKDISTEAVDNEVVGLDRTAGEGIFETRCPPSPLPAPRRLPVENTMRRSAPRPFAACRTATPPLRLGGRWA